MACKTLHLLLSTASNFNVSKELRSQLRLKYEHPERAVIRRTLLKLAIVPRFIRGNPRRYESLVEVAVSAGGVSPPPLDLTEDNIRLVLDDARVELGQIFDASVGITGHAELAELDGPFVKISLKGRFWHKRSTVLARIGNYLKQRIPEILEVEIEDEKQLDDSPENF